MSVGHRSQHSRRLSSSSAGRNIARITTPLSIGDSAIESVDDGQLQPCAATASIFLFAQGKNVLCLNHDTLTVERRFERHRDRVALLAVDNVSERGAGRLVWSYDVEQTAMVWDLFTGDEITRIASFKPLKAAAWMKNGNIAFGDTEGTVAVFEPSTSEHKTKKTINTPITAIAPAADCETFVIGYENGSILIASLLPNFTILHTLSTPREPSAVVGLAWHASSSKQKSDMLAVQCAGGDLRVWSIAKPAIADTPRTIRVLQRGETDRPGNHWIAWSKNGRIIQFSQDETWAWDVRTKHVAYEPVPTIEGVRGIANFGPGAALFTIGPNYTVQQYDTNPPTLVKTATHDPRQASSSQSTPKLNAHTIVGAAPPMPKYRAIDPPKTKASLSTIQRATEHLSAAEHARKMRGGMGSPMSSASRTESIDSRGSSHRGRRAPSISAASGTTFSTLSPSLLGRETQPSPFWPSTASVSSSGRRSQGSRLRYEAQAQQDSNLLDLFPNTRARLASLPYTPESSALDQATASPEQLRRQMLEIVFGWHGDIVPMIQDEVRQHPVGSMSAVLLSKWLGDVDADVMSSMPSDSISQNDWMLLALTSMSGNGPAGQQMARTFASRLVAQGDIHTAATVLIGIKDFDEAVEIYVSRNFFMEGILLTCLLFPDEWQRQSFLVRRWGEYVVENSQQHLAIRCFTCTGTTTSLPWATPTQSPFQSVNTSTVGTMSPPISPPFDQKPARMTAKNASLKLITTFGPSDAASKFSSQKLEDRTPTNQAGITPIAESAISPSATPTTYLRGPFRARTPGGHNGRLSSIGETPIDVNPPSFPITRPHPLPTPDNSGSDAEKEAAIAAAKAAEKSKAKIEDPPLTLSSARYNPNEETNLEVTPQTAVPSSAQRRNMLSDPDSTPIPNQDRARLSDKSRERNPHGLQITAPSLSQLNLNAIATGSDGKTPASVSSRRRSAGSANLARYNPRSGELTTPGTGQSWTSLSTKSPSVGGRSVDAKISSLEEASYHAKQQKEKERARRHRSRDTNGEKTSRSKSRQREYSESRGRAGQRYVRPAKRSPSSPVPMSPDEVHEHRNTLSRDSSPEEGPLDRSRKQRHVSKDRSTSKVSDWSQRTTLRHRSPENRHIDEPQSARSRSRRQSPNGYLESRERRSRSTSRAIGAGRSPSVPLPTRRYDNGEQEDDMLRLVDSNRQRVQSRNRSSSRKATDRGTSRTRDQIMAIDHISLESVQYPTVNGMKSEKSPRASDPDQGGSDGSGPRLQRNRSERSLKKAAAARELEARRESLNLRTVGTMAKPTHGRPGMNGRSQSDMNGFNSGLSHEVVHDYQDDGPYSAELTPPARTGSAGPSPRGLPSTPRAMRQPKQWSRDDGIPSMPAIPDQFYATGQPMFEPSRSMSAPVPEPDMSIPTDIPIHPAFQRHLPRTKKANFPSLNAIGKHRRTSSVEQTLTLSPPYMSSIHEALERGDGNMVIDVPVMTNGDAVMPELAHLAGPLPPPLPHHAASPPPPPPPPPPPFARDQAHHSLSSGSGVGTINIVMDEDSGESPGARSSLDKIVISPPLPNGTYKTKQEPPLSGNSHASSTSPKHSADNQSLNSDGRGHRRGRSINDIGTKFTRMAERMRSTSRGRNVASNGRTRDPSRDARISPPMGSNSPYETKVAVGVGFF